MLHWWPRLPSQAAQSCTRSGTSTRSPSGIRRTPPYLSTACAWRIPLLIPPTLLALWILRRRGAEWFAVPAVFPATQFYYVAMALDVSISGMMAVSGGALFALGAAFAACVTTARQTVTPVGHSNPRSLTPDP